MPRQQSLIPSHSRSHKKQCDRQTVVDIEVYVHVLNHLDFELVKSTREKISQYKLVEEVWEVRRKSMYNPILSLNFEYMKFEFCTDFLNFDHNWYYIYIPSQFPSQVTFTWS